MEVHHINLDPSDNRADNLQWCSQAENRKWKRSGSGVRGRPVIQRNLDGSFVAQYARITDAPFNNSSIVAACRGRIHTAYGYKWEYDPEDLENEIWKEIPTEVGPVQVSSQGRVRLTSGKRSFGWNCRNGYRISAFKVDRTSRKWKCFLVHRLIAMAFCPLPNDIHSFDVLDVDHLNGIRDDNCAKNLEWVTKSENMRRANQSRTKPRNCFRRRVQAIPVEGGTTRTFSSLRDAANAVPGTHPGNIIKVLQGKQKSAGGHKWKDVGSRPWTS